MIEKTIIYNCYEKEDGRMDKEYLLLIDGSSLLSTQYYGNLPREIMFAKTNEEREAFYGKIMQTSMGIYTNAIYGFMRTFLKILREQKPTHVAVTWDLSRDTFRREIDSDYKGTRGETPSPLKEQFKLCQEILAKMNVMQFMDSKYEADDFCGSIASKLENEIPVRILTKDTDYLQLVSENTKLWLMFTTQEKADDLFKKYEIKKSTANIPDKAFELTPELVKSEYGIKPEQVADLKSLVGDKSDNIKGVAGVGEASAVPLINEYGTVENLYEHIRNLDKKQEKEIKDYWKTKLGIKRSPLTYLLKTSDTEIVGEKSAIISKKLAIIKKDIDLGELNRDSLKLNIDIENGNAEFKKLEFKSLNLKDALSHENEDENNEKKHECNIKINSIDNIEEFSELMNKVKDRIYISYTLNDSSIYSKLDLKHIIIISEEDISNVIDFEKIASEDNIKSIELLKNVMENDKVKKVIHDGKNLVTFLNKNNITVKEFDFDTAIAAYLLDSAQSKYNLTELIEKYLNEEIDGSESENEGILGSYIPKLYMILKSNIEKEKMDKLYYEVEHPLIFVLSSMESIGFNINQSMLDELKIKFDSEIQRTQKEIYELADEEFNVSSPKQLGKILFEKLDLPIIKKTKTGYSTNQEVLEKLLDKHEIIPKIMYYRQITKISSTYVEGLKNVIDEDGRIHSNFNQTVTTTGRLSSTDPNLQNIPIRHELGREIRKVFIPLQEGDTLVSCDYSQIELRVLAHIAGDENMIDAFKHHSDIHTKTASEVFKVPVEDVTSLMRSRAKAVNFGIVYGISAFSLSQDLKIPKAEAQEYMNIYFERYPKIKSYLENIVSEAEEKGYVLTILNRRRFIPEINASNKIVKALGERLAMNAPIQGSAADIIKIAMINVYNKLKESKMQSKLILQVHDELILNVKENEFEEVKKIVVDEMENAIKLSVGLDVDINSGKTWYEAK
ncbi:DNA polymerase I [Clostridium butyricum]|uniref:DNA polymerase I n=1 Tax=Clostridium butyricum TaxID=1492 RepID=UPI003D134462